MSARRALALAGACLALALAGPARATGVTFVVRAPAGTSAADTLWVSGDRAELGNWSGAGLRLARLADGAWTATLGLPAGTAIAFKVTRGDWKFVEKDAQGGEVPNRTWTVRADDTVRVAVAAWRDQTEKPGAERVHTLTGDVRRHDRFPSAFVPARDVLVWLPPGYDAQPARRYPVVYFLDGQNVFDGATSFIPGQEWGADEAADRLIRAGQLPPCILVAVANSPARMDEYTWASDARHGGGKGALHARFLAEELKPFIDRTYRTQPAPEHTAIVGSSLGGLAALDVLLAHPGSFGLAGSVSTSVFWADHDIVRRVGQGQGHAGRIWLDIGTAEESPTADGRMPWVEDARALHAALLARGWRDGADLHYEEIEGARHNEAAWRARVERILSFLLGAPGR